MFRMGHAAILTWSLTKSSVERQGSCLTHLSLESQVLEMGSNAALRGPVTPGMCQPFHMVHHMVHLANML